MLKVLYWRHFHWFVRNNFLRNKTMLFYYQCKNCSEGGYVGLNCGSFIFLWCLYCDKIHFCFYTSFHLQCFRILHFWICVQSSEINQFYWRSSISCEYLLFLKRFSHFILGFESFIEERSFAYLYKYYLSLIESKQSWLILAYLYSSTSIASELLI